MSYDPDVLLDRRRLKRRLRLWQFVTLFVLLAGVLALLQSQGALFPGERIARVHIEGIIVRDEARNQALAKLAKDDEIRAVIVHIDSPGGSVVGGEDLYNSLREISENKPVAAVMGTVATSAAYMTSIAADQVWARESTVTGSIGVILQSANITDLLRRIGVEPLTIKSSKLKGTPSPFEPLTKEARAATQGLVQDLYEFFVDIVIDRRPIEAEAARELADGRVFSGRQAVANGLIDAIGGEKDAISWMVREQGIPAELSVETIKARKTDDGFLNKLVKVSGKSLFPNALTLDGIVSLWQPAGR
jgi:protease-4